MQFVKTIGCQFSGKATVYAYGIFSELHAAQVRVGDRVVVPHAKLKDDGSLSLSIATVVEVHETPVSVPDMLPIVDVIDHNAIAAVAIHLGGGVSNG